MNAHLKLQDILQYVKSPKYLLQVVIVALVYFAFGRLGLLFDAVSGFATLVWAPTGISVAVLFLLGRRYALGVLIGAYMTNLTIGAEPLIALSIAVGNTCEALVAVTLLRGLKFNPELNRVADVLNLVIPVAFISTLISATIGSIILFVSHTAVTFDSLSATWFAWWLGDMIGAIIFAPLIFVWYPVFANNEKVEFSTDGFLPFFILMLLGVTIFFGRMSMLDVDFEAYRGYVYPIFIPFIWLVFHVRQRMVVTSLFLISVIAIWATAVGNGPFAGVNLSDSLFELQVFLGTLAVTVLFLSATIAERDAEKRRR